MNAPAKIGPHYRVPWRPHDPEWVWVHSRLDEVKGTYRRGAKEGAAGTDRYMRAKHEFDMEAAVEIINEGLSADVVDIIIDCLLVANKPPVVVMPHPKFDAGEGVIDIAGGPTNALPFALAATLAVELGCETDEAIHEIARPGRTKLNTFERFIWQPRFDGAVRPDRAYLLVDDAVSCGGTLACLRSFIVEHGGTVFAATALANPERQHVRFPITDGTVRSIVAVFGPEIDGFWKQEIGHGIGCLTEVEGQRLAEWGAKHCATFGPGPRAVEQLRNRIARAAASAG